MLLLVHVIKMLKKKEINAIYFSINKFTLIGANYSN